MNKHPEMTILTKQRIMDAFWALALEDDVLHMTVSGIVKKAGVNRSTFYVYFEDMIDLTEQVENQLLDDFVETVEGRILSQIPITLETFSQISLGIFPMFADKLFYFLGRRQERSFETKLRDRMTPYLCLYAGLDGNMPDFKYIQTYIFSAMRGIFVTWYEEGKAAPIEDILPMGQKLVAEGLFGYVAKTK